MANENKRKENSQENNRNGSRRSVDRIGQMNESKRQAKIIEEENKKKKEAQEINDEKPNSINRTTSRFLKAAWENLFFSFGATFIWIDIHVFLGAVLGHKSFCKLGREWVPEEVKVAHPELAEKIGKKAGFYEGIGVALINLILVLYIIWILMINAMILKVINNPLDSFAALIGWMWGSGSVVPFSKS